MHSSQGHFINYRNAYYGGSESTHSFTDLLTYSSREAADSVAFSDPSALGEGEMGTNLSTKSAAISNLVYDSYTIRWVRVGERESPSHNTWFRLPRVRCSFFELSGSCPFSFTSPNWLFQVWFDLMVLFYMDSLNKTRSLFYVKVHEA